MNRPEHLHTCEACGEEIGKGESLCLDCFYGKYHWIRPEPICPTEPAKEASKRPKRDVEWGHRLWLFMPPDFTYHPRVSRTRLASETASPRPNPPQTRSPTRSGSQPHQPS